MTVQELCKGIELQDTVAMKVDKFLSSYDFDQIKSVLNELIIPQTAEAACKKLETVLEDDEDHIPMLACQLLGATRLYDKYLQKGISHTIFMDTMKCFTRFIGECEVKTGRAAFDRAWWTYRQLSMVLFRIGELEYELVEENGKKEVSIHIPSNARLSKEKVDDSLALAKEFMDKYYTEYAEVDYICDSWLLAPKLKEVLDEDSHIIGFQNRFNIVKVDIDAKDIFEWLFKTSVDCELESLRENTSLQRKVKQLLLNGEKVGIAFGVLKQE